MPAFDPSTHDDLIDIDINLQALSSGAASFTTLAILVDTATPGGGIYAEYASSTEVAADVTLGNLNSIAQEIADVAFAQAKRPIKIIFGAVDTLGGQTYVQALDAMIGAGANFYGLAIDSRTDADIIAISNDLETKAAAGTYFMFFAQDDDADWLTTAIPAAFSTIAGNERTAMYYHDDNANDATSARLDVAHAADRLSYDPDTKSAGWTSPVADVIALATSLTQTQKAFARANYANTALPFGTLTDSYVDPGKTLGGRSIDHIVSVDWFRARAVENVADLMTAQSAKGVKLTVDADGQAKIGNVIEGLMQTGVDIRHFLDKRLTPLSVTTADITAQRVRFDGELQWATGIRTISLGLYFSTDALA